MVRQTDRQSDSTAIPGRAEFPIELMAYWQGIKCARRVPGHSEAPRRHMTADTPALCRGAQLFFLF